MGKLNKFRNILALVIVVGVISVTIAISLNIGRKKEVKPAKQPKLPANVEVSLEAPHYTEVREGVKKWDLTAEQADLRKGRQTIGLTKPKLVVYLARKPGVVTVTGDQAIYHVEKRVVQVTGHVVATGSGYRFTTPTATFDAVQSLLTTQDRVLLTLATSRVAGKGLRLKSDEGTVEVLSQVSAELHQQDFHEKK